MFLQGHAVFDGAVPFPSLAKSSLPPFHTGGWKNDMALSCCSIFPDGRNNFASAVFFPKEACSQAIW
jgi:hypothetical protein